MEPIFAAAIDHIRLMEARIAKQEATIQQLSDAGQDTSESESKLRLLHAALDEMRLQLPRLVPTEEQIAAPMWALPVGNAGRERRTA